jgi:NAD(P)-dependent dehydrogenase (short-subunit alcohol dehydrogenase family)
MAQLLEGHVVVVTGGTRGIGLAIAQAVLAEGARVLITGRSQTSVDEGLAKLPMLRASQTPLPFLKKHWRCLVR